MDSQQPQYYYQQNTAPQDTYRGNAQSPAPAVYQPPTQPVPQQIQQVQPIQYVQQPVVQQMQPQCICQQPMQVQYMYQPQAMSVPNAQYQNRDLGDIVTSVIGDEKMKETMKDEEIKMLKAQLDLLDNKLSEMIAKKVRKFCF